MKIIKDVKGGKLRLTKVKLTEVTGYTQDPYYLLLSELKRHMQNKGGEYLPLYHVGKSFSIPSCVSESICKIGCRTFSKRTFATIMKAAGVKL